MIGSKNRQDKMIFGGFSEYPIYSRVKPGLRLAVGRCRTTYGLKQQYEGRDTLLAIDDCHLLQIAPVSAQRSHAETNNGGHEMTSASNVCLFYVGE